MRKIRKYKQGSAAIHLYVAFSFVFLFAGFAKAGILNEWGFGSDPAGRTLSQSVNDGSDEVDFSSGNEVDLMTDGVGGLVCTQDDSGSTSGMWANGAVLNATLPFTVSGEVQFLRFDFSYDLSDTERLNNSGGVVGFTFYDDTGNEAAGVVLAKDVGAGASSPYGTEILAELPLAGMMVVIARVDLPNQRMDLWYDLSGGTDGYSELSPTTHLDISIASFASLRFHATGDIQPAGSTDEVIVDLLRTAGSWTEILMPPLDETLLVSVIDPFTQIEIGVSNLVTVVIENVGTLATEVTSSLTHDGAPSDCTIFSNNTPALLASTHLLTNTYWVVANTEGEYSFTVKAFSARTQSPETNFAVRAGSKIDYLSNTVVEVPGGSLPGLYEPGETIDITVVSTNSGATTVSDIENSLSVDLAWFLPAVVVPPSSATYDLMGRGETTSTTYRVTIEPDTPHGSYGFGVTNRSGEKVWGDVFRIDVFSQAIPSVSPVSVVLTAVPGQSDVKTVMVTNSGNAPVTFSISDSGPSADHYTLNVGRNGGWDGDLDDPHIPLEHDQYPETRGISAAIPMGFSFPLYGTLYSNFYVTADGVIGLSNSTNTPALGDGDGSLPDGNGNPLFAPFWGSLCAPERSIRYVADKERIAISYYNVDWPAYRGEPQTFQVILYGKDTPDHSAGQIEFRYEEVSGNFDRVTVGIQGDAASYTNLPITPESGKAWLLTPQLPDSLVTWSPLSGTVDPQGSVPVTFMLDAAGRTNGAVGNYTLRFDWSSGGASDVAISASVSAVPEYEAVSSLSFSGPAGEVVTAPFIITNNGTGSLEFSIFMHQSYAFSVTNMPFAWEDLAGMATVLTVDQLNDPDPNPYITAADQGFSDVLPLGRTYSSLHGNFSEIIIHVDGTLELGSVATWTPYSADLMMDANAVLKYHVNDERLVVIWENMKQFGLNGGDDITFQVILTPSGDRTFQYLYLEGGQWPKSVLPGIIQTSDWWTVTNDISGHVYTNYLDEVEERAISSLVSDVQVIRYEPVAGTVPAGDLFEVTIIGDALNQPEGVDVADATAQLEIIHNGGGVDSTNTLDVSFSCTNSAGDLFVRGLPLSDGTVDSDGDGLTDNEERIAGTDTQDPGSVFSPTVTRTESGILLSWDEPLDGEQRIYNVYWTTNLNVGWDWLAVVDEGISYSHDTDEPVVYYKVSVE